MSPEDERVWQILRRHHANIVLWGRVQKVGGESLFEISEIKMWGPAKKEYGGLLEILFTPKKPLRITPEALPKVMASMVLAGGAVDLAQRDKSGSSKAFGDAWGLLGEVEESNKSPDVERLQNTVEQVAANADAPIVWPR